MTPMLDAVVRELNVLALIGIAGFLWFVGWRRYRLDLFRQRLFALRDELFDLAADGQIPFNSFAYGGLRQQINGTIRFGHRLNSTQIIALSIFRADPPDGIEEPLRRWRLAVDALDDDVKKKLLDIHDRLMYEMVAKIAFTSVFMLLTLGVVLLVMMVAIGASRVIKIVGRVGDKVPALSAVEQELEIAA